MTMRAPLTFPVPPSAPIASCRSCGAAVVWIVTPAGKRMPVDVSTHVSHFATCPNAAQHRKVQR
jgi:hypothetical protein